MITRVITPEQREYAWRLVKSTNYGNRGEFDGNREKQYTGILGEVCFADLYGLPRPVKKSGYDHGIDFVIAPHNVDLKTMARCYDWKTHFTNNLIYDQVHNPRNQATAYVFANINKKTGNFQVIGYQSKWQITQSCRLLDKGTLRTRSDGTTFPCGMTMYEVDGRDLYDADLWLVDHISKL